MFKIMFCLFCSALVLLGAAVHERYLAENFAATGDAKAWFYEIKIPENCK